MSEDCEKLHPRSSYLLDSTFPHFSSHLSWSSAAPVSREALKVPVAASRVRGSGKATVCAPPSGHHHYNGHHRVGSVQPGMTPFTCLVIKCACDSLCAISGCVTLHSCHTRPYSMLYSGCLSVRSVWSPCSASFRPGWQNFPVIMPTCVPQMSPASRD